MKDPLISAITAKTYILEAEAPPSAWLEAALPFQDGEPTTFSLLQVLVIPAVLLLIGAMAGGLRALFASPLRSHFLSEQSARRREQIEDLAQRRPLLATVAGLVRVLSVFAAVVLMVEGTGDATQVEKWIAWVGVMLFGGFLLEGLNALAAHGRGFGFILIVLPIVRICEVPLRPVAALLSAMVRGLGGQTAGNTDTTLATNMLEVVQESEREEELEESERRMIHRIIDLPDTDAAEVMTPRTKLIAVEGSSSVGEALAVSVQEGHSRIPVYDTDLDHVVGIFYVKDILDDVVGKADFTSRPVRECMREPFIIPETMRLPMLFEEMRRRRIHMAVALDEYGGTAGIVTVEDLVEEIVGEISDEHDRVTSTAIEQVGPGELIVDGAVGLTDLNEVLDTDLPEDDDFDTIAGLLFDRFGHVPARGECLQEQNVLLEVVEADDRRIRRVRVRRHDAATDTDAA